MENVFEGKYKNKQPIITGKESSKRTHFLGIQQTIRHRTPIVRIRR
jgi:hypothetical protein